MTEVKNLLFQPLTLHLAGGESLHLGPRQRRVIGAGQASPELEKAARRGLVTLVERADAETNADSATTTPATEGAPSA